MKSDRGDVAKRQEIGVKELTNGKWLVFSHSNPYSSFITETKEEGLLMIDKAIKAFERYNGKKQTSQ